MFKWLGLFRCEMVVRPFELVSPSTIVSELRHNLVVVFLVGTYFLVFSVRLRKVLGQVIMQSNITKNDCNHRNSYGVKEQIIQISG